MSEHKFKADERLKTIVENCYKTGHRFLLFIYDDPDSETSCNGQQVMLLHHLISRNFSQRPKVLWCHKKDANTPQVSNKTLKKLEKEIKSGKANISKENAFSIFLLSTAVTFCDFQQTESILGKTYGMCVIQDFEGLTPNIICRISETVCGGGAVVFLLPKTVSNLKSVHSLTMDVHSKFTSHSYPEAQHRFNKRFVLSLGWCKTCLVLNKDFQIRYELEAHKHLQSLSAKEKPNNEEEEKIKELLESVADAEKPLPQLMKLCSTMDQAKVVLKLIDVITEKSGKSTVSLTASRGRGKSAALGLATAAAIYFGHNNIYVTSPSPENLSTYFEFVFKGFDALDYEENTHYNIIQSTNPEFKDAIIRVTVFARLRQVIQYVSPSDSQKVRHTELVIIDEAAAIPLKHVKALLGPHNVFMASTINGYEGTGRSLSLKLLKELRQQSVSTKEMSQEEAILTNNRPLHELTLETSIRYQPNDPVEKWMYRLMCLDTTSSIPSPSYCPHPNEFELYYVNKDVLFSGHPDTEDFLHQVISLLVSSHYKNSPNDLQMLADSSSQHLFVLIQKVEQKNLSSLPTVFAVIQVSLEGGISSKVSKSVLKNGKKMDGDLIPWFLSREASNPQMTKLKSLRVLRVATHPDYQSMGYGTRAMKLLKEYYHGRFINIGENSSCETAAEMVKSSSVEGDDLLIGPTTVEEPLLMKLSDRTPEPIEYIGVSFGVTEPLFKFWKKSSFLPIHISPSENKITGEHNCIMICPMTEEFVDSLQNDGEISLPIWLKNFVEAFFDGFLDKLSTCFSSFSPRFAVSIISTLSRIIKSEEIEWKNLEFRINARSLARIESYAKSFHERHHITNLLRPIADLIFRNRLPSVLLSYTQSEILLGVGLQFLSMDDVSEKLDLPIESILGQFHRAIKRIFKSLSDVQEKTVAREVEEEAGNEDDFTPVTISLEQELEDTAYEFKHNLKPLPAHEFGQYAINVDEEEWKNAAKSNRSTISIKRNKRPTNMTEEELEKEFAPPPTKKGVKGMKYHSSNSKRGKNKKR